MDLLCDAAGFNQPPEHLDQPQSTSRPRQESSSGEGRGQSTDASGSTRFQCHICGRTYERADHLNRHRKSHENARPHKCTQCPKTFNRADLLTRHKISHGQPGKARSYRYVDGKERVAAACAACVLAKAKCHDEKPCARCQRKGIACETSGPSGKFNEKSPSWSEIDGNGSGSVLSTNISNQPDIHMPVDKDLLLSPKSVRDSAAPSPRNNINSGIRVSRTAVQSSHAANSQPCSVVRGDWRPSSTLSPNTIHVSSNQLSSFLDYQDFSCLGTEPLLSPGFGLVPRESYFSQDLDFGLWDVNLDFLEFASPSIENDSTEEPISHLQPSQSAPSRKAASKRHAAFERSPWVWTPTQKDKALNDQQDLGFNEENIPSVLTPASPDSSVDEFASFCINEKQRDHMISLLFTLRKVPTQSPYFPSLSLLNNIIQVYFAQESFRVDQLIHTATFSPLNALPQLLLAIVSAGSALISIPAVWKMGLALQEVVRHTVAEYWETDNSHTRNLQALQAFMIGLDVGLWSGFKRKMEIAESFAQPIVVMLRRAGAFATPANNSILIPDFGDSDAILESKWRKWVERESFKRLVLHLFMHDIHASIGFQKPPLISFTELKFYLPASRSLWLAKSASEWRDLYLSSQSSSSIPTFMDAMQEQEILHELSSKVDIHLTAISLLHGFWGQIWSLLESKKFYPASKSTHRLALHTSHTELYRDLNSFSMHLPSLTRNSPEALLISELLQMILHVHPEDLQRFAGKFGEEEERKASESFAEWSKTKEARIAIWHAGQIFSAAGRLMPAQNRGFNAIALYYSSLTLWVYGLMVSGTSPTVPATPQNMQLLSSSISTSHSGQAHVVLNEPETNKNGVFFTSNIGIAVISVASGDVEGGKKFVELTHTNKILEITRNIYRSNFPVLEEPLPPLVENLGNLLRDLRSLPGSRVSRAPSENLD